MSRYYPINLDVRGRACLVVGGGKVARRKVQRLLDAGAEVTVVAPEVHPKIEADPRIEVRKRAYRDADLHNVFVVVVATDDAITNRAVAQDAMDLGLPVNTVDCPALSSFIVPATVRRGELLIAVSTAGASPMLSRRIREKLEDEFGEEYAVFVELLGELRRDVLDSVDDPDRRNASFRALTEDRWREMLKSEDVEVVKERMRELVNEMQ